MVETFYVQLELISKNNKTTRSIKLPFLCNRCGKCCTLENFLTAGKINDPKNTRPEVRAVFKALAEDLGKLWKKDEDKYDQHIIDTPCPFLSADNSCSIYEIRPDGCKLYPNTKFGIDSSDCEALIRFKKQKNALKKGKRCKETYCCTEIKLLEPVEPIKDTKSANKWSAACVNKLQQIGITDDELLLFLCLNTT